MSIKPLLLCTLAIAHAWIAHAAEPTPSVDIPLTDKAPQPTYSAKANIPAQTANLVNSDELRKTKLTTYTFNYE